MIASWGPWGRPSSIVMVVSWEFHQQPMTNSSLVSIAPSYSFDDTTKKAGTMQRCPGWGKPREARLFVAPKREKIGFLDVTGYFPNLPDDVLDFLPRMLRTGLCMLGYTGFLDEGRLDKESSNDVACLLTLGESSHWLREMNRHEWWWNGTHTVL